MESIQFISTSPTALVNLIDEAVKRRLEEFKKNIKTKEETTYMTRQQVADLLHVDLSTIWKYTKQKKLIGYSIAQRVLYKRKEVEAAIVQLNK